MSYYASSEIPRHEPENPENLSKVKLVERENAIKEIRKLYPDASPKIIEMCWNYINRKGINTVREEIEGGHFDKPSQFSNVSGDVVLKTGWVYNPDGSLVEPDDTSSSSQTNMLTDCSVSC
jgi:hypothetical protein